MTCDGGRNGIRSSSSHSYVFVYCCFEVSNKAPQHGSSRACHAVNPSIVCLPACLPAVLDVCLSLYWSVFVCNVYDPFKLHDDRPSLIQAKSKVLRLGESNVHDTHGACSLRPVYLLRIFRTLQRFSIQFRFSTAWIAYRVHNRKCFVELAVQWRNLRYRRHGHGKPTASEIHNNAMVGGDYNDDRYRIKC